MKRAGFIISMFAAAEILVLAGRSYAAVGLCVKDDSLAKAAAINASDTASGWDGGWGDTWTARSTNGSLTVEGMATCLNTSSKGGDGKPAAWTYGASCWCNVASINNKNVSGAWVFTNAYDSYESCAERCAPYCSRCVRYGANGSCARSALVAPI
ncbi:MAG: hypothetical protein LBL21_03570 [Rickettsiales bacterium]|jgi:hypothetical protein|nr:hypothetical protein [Rickettsiales bacterium]